MPSRRLQPHPRVGAGPARSTAATILAMHGRRVVLLEREGFPRYHVGESLLPFCYSTLNRLGMVDKLNATDFVKKHSVQFATIDGRTTSPLPTCSAPTPRCSNSAR